MSLRLKPEVKLYNTLSRSKEVFAPESDIVRIYTCGPTVYNLQHIGNLMALTVSDLIKRVLKFDGYRIEAVMNVTDVDDKTIGQSKTEHPGASALEALKLTTTKYQQIFEADAEALNVDFSDTKIIRATDNIEIMQDLIRAIDDAGIAYMADGSIYFSIDQYVKAGHDYGRLQRVDFVPDARIDNDEYDKEEARDFVLWKAAKDGEPSWDFAFKDQNLPGRPGWHIECSAMSTKYLGQPFDIHTGGVDLIFPHHENEIAQSQAGAGKDLSNFWLHNAHLLVEGAKMSKSKGNVYDLKEIRDRGFDPLVFRLMILGSHYRSQLDFSWKNLEAYRTRLERLRDFVQSLQEVDADQASDQTQALVEDFELKFVAAINDDLNTPQALAALNGLEKEINKVGLDQVSRAEAEEVLEAILGADKVLGLRLDEVEAVKLTAEVEGLLAKREVARAGHDFKKSDELRDKIKTLGYGVEDTGSGQKVRKI